MAVLLGLSLATRLGRARGIEPSLIADLLPLMVLGAVIGARVYYVALEWRQYSGNWLDAIRIWRGGIAIHGALLGGSLATMLFCRWRRQPFWQLLDVLMPAVALGQAIGRWGNFFNSEAFGLPTDLPWKLQIPAASRPAEFLSSSTFTPPSSTNPFGIWGCAPYCWRYFGPPVAAAFSCCLEHSAACI